MAIAPRSGRFFLTEAGRYGADQHRSVGRRLIGIALRLGHSPGFPALCLFHIAQRTPPSAPSLRPGSSPSVRTHPQPRADRT